MMLHDYHRGRDGCNPCTQEDKCFSLLELQHEGRKQTIPFFDMLNKIAQKGTTVDFFYEAWRESNYKPQFNSALHDVIKEVEICIPESHRILECPYPYIRIHKSDPRDNIKDAEFVFIVIYNIQSYSVFKTDIETRYRNFSADTILRLVYDRLYTGSEWFFKNVFISHPFFQSYSDTFKQMYQLPEVCQKSLLTSYHTYPAQIPDDVILSPEDKRYKHVNMLNTFVRDTFSSRDIFSWTQDMKIEEAYALIRSIIKLMFQYTHVSWIGGSAAFDLYFLSRCLKTPHRGSPSQVTVMYAGDIHCLNILHFLTKATNYYECSNFGYRLMYNPYIKCVFLNQPKETIFALCDEFNTSIFNMLNRGNEPLPKWDQIELTFFNKFVQMRKLVPIFYTLML